MLVKVAGHHSSGGEVTGEEGPRPNPSSPVVSPPEL